ncbi:MAG: hypothetical protein ACXAEU_13640 [Candidatus Hodarchaeales archaeon]
MSQESRNVRISGIAWELLRWSKYKLNTKSYSETILQMNEKIAKTRSKLLKRTLRNFDEKRHRVKIKVPKDTGGGSSSVTSPKTILLDPEARKTLEWIKIASNEPAYTFSDAIEFLVSENGLMPDHLKYKK